MKKGLKITLIVLGSLLGVVALDLGISLIVNAATKVETVHYLKDKSFNKIDINVGTADIEFKYLGGDPYIHCIESSFEKHDVKVENNTLKIDSSASERLPLIMVSSQRKIEVCLPTNNYYNQYKVNIHHSTGDIIINKNYIFSELNIEGSTGDVKVDTLGVNGNFNIKQSTGDINTYNVGVSHINFETSTGHMNLDKVKCAGIIRLKSSTGSKRINKVEANSLIVESSTGSVGINKSNLFRKLNIESTTGDVNIVDSDSYEIDIKTTTGDITAEFRTSKIVYAKSSTGNIDVPKSTSGGLCSIETSTGDIKVTFKK